MLALSYDYLPHNLRACFLYLANFPKDYHIPVEKLYHLWEAEELLEQQSRLSGVISQRLASKEDIAIGYVNELIGRSLLQVGEMTRRGKVKACHLPHQTRYMCVAQAIKEKFVDVIRDAPSHHQWFERTMSRRLAFHLEEGAMETEHSELLVKGSKNIKSLMIFASKQYSLTNNFLVKAIMEAPLIRILDLEGISMTELPEEVGELVFLRYLSLKGSTITKLPSSIGKLGRLLILDLRVSDATLVIHNELWRIETLTHMYLPLHFVCKSGHSLKLKGLIHLETLINLDPTRCQLEEIQGLDKLRRVSFTKDYYFEDAKGLEFLMRCPSVVNNALKKPLILGIDAKTVNTHPTILLSSSPDQGCSFDLSFHQLKIRGNMSIKTLESFPTIFPPNLTYLVLERSRIERDPMPLLEKLPGLRHLCLRECLKEGVKEVVCCSESFPHLTTLVLYLLPDVRDWIVEAGAMPNLAKLCMDNCPYLEAKGIPRELSTAGKTIQLNDYPTLMKSNGGFRR